MYAAGLLALLIGVPLGEKTLAAGFDADVGDIVDASIGLAGSIIDASAGNS